MDFSIGLAKTALTIIGHGRIIFSLEMTNTTHTFLCKSISSRDFSILIKIEGMVHIFLTPHLLSQPHPDDCQVICAILFDPKDLQLPKAPPHPTLSSQDKN